MTKSTALAGALLSNAPSTLVTAERKVSFLATQKEKAQSSVVFSKIDSTKPGVYYGAMSEVTQDEEPFRTEISTEHFISEKSEKECGFGALYKHRDGSVEDEKHNYQRLKKVEKTECGSMKNRGCYFVDVVEIWKGEGRCGSLSFSTQPCVEKFKGLYADGSCPRDGSVCECVHKDDLSKKTISSYEWSEKDEQTQRKWAH